MSADLMQSLEFTADDLLANRAGQLSERQLERLRRSRTRYLLIGGGMIALFGLIATIFLFLGQRNESAILSLAGVAVTICNAAVMGVLARQILRLNEDINRKAASSIEGAVGHKINMAGRGAANYIIKIGGEEVIVNKSTFFAMQDGHNYRIYRAPASRVLLAAEAI